VTPTAVKTSGRATSHPTTIRKGTSPQAPRRVSGPAGGVTHPGTRRAVSGRSAPLRRAPAREAASIRARALAVRVGAQLRALPDHSLLDRIIRGRAWIPLLGVMLAGIVAMQVEVLKLSASIGRSIERGSALQSRNEILRASVAGLVDDQRIERIAAGMGMVMPAPDAVDFLPARAGADVGAALAGIHAPNASGFTALLPVASSPTVSSTVTPGSAGAATSAVTAAGGAATVSPTTSSTSPSGVGTSVSSSSQTAGVVTTPPSGTAAPPTQSPASSSQPPSAQQSSATGGAAPVGG
jgi:hypothetical protein